KSKPFLRARKQSPPSCFLSRRKTRYTLKGYFVYKYLPNKSLENLKKFKKIFKHSNFNLMLLTKRFNNKLTNSNHSSLNELEHGRTMFFLNSQSLSQNKDLI